MLENKLKITNAVELAHKEEELSKKNAVLMYETGFLDSLQAGTFASLAAIHHFLFHEIYGFAGTVRTENIAKGGFRFASATYLEAALGEIEKMPQSTFEEIVQKYVEMNVAHPFREGNGRSGRIWLDCILKKELAKVIDWSLISKDDYLAAMERSPIKDVEITVLLQGALSSDIHSRDVYLQGIDVSYVYEGLATFKTQDFFGVGRTVFVMEGTQQTRIKHARDHI